jgi:hypothetical protein
LNVERVRSLFQLCTVTDRLATTGVLHDGGCGSEIASILYEFFIILVSLTRFSFKSSQQAQRMFQSEICIHSSLDHENVCEYKGNFANVFMIERTMNANLRFFSHVFSFKSCKQWLKHSAEETKTNLKIHIIILINNKKYDDVYRKMRFCLFYAVFQHEFARFGRKNA